MPHTGRTKVYPGWLLTRVWFPKKSNRLKKIRVWFVCGETRRLKHAPEICSVLAAGTSDPLLIARVENEWTQIGRIAVDGLAKRTFIVPWLVIPPIGLEQSSHLVANAEKRVELNNELL
jgi:hypothetical protein